MIYEDNTMIRCLQRCLLPTILVAAVLTGCTRVDEGMNEAIEDKPVRRAVAEIQPMNESGVSGMVNFEEVGDYVKVAATVSGLGKGKHGFHIHEGLSCESYGGHFAPEGSDHGSPDAVERHVGDLGQLVAGDDSTARYERVDHVISFDGPHSILGHAVIVHEGADDYVSQPSGAGGTVIGCGVIRAESQPEE